MVTSQVDLARMAAMIPDGVTPGSDKSSLVVGVVTGLDIPNGRVQVVVGGAEPVWVAAAPFIYDEDARVRVRRDVGNGGRLEFCEGPISPGSMFVTGYVTVVGESSLTVETLGGVYELQPFAAGTYAVDDLVWVMRHPTGFGEPQAVLGAAGGSRAGGNPGGGSGNPGELQQRQAVISPQDSGSFKAAQSRWDSWNTDRYGGVRALWQGNQYGSGPMIGWAGYGDQVVNLHATRITGMWLDVQRSDSSDPGGRVAFLMGSPNGTRPGGAPAGSGDAASTPSLRPNESARIYLPPGTYDGWRTGGFKGLRTVGADYLALYGADRGGAMVLTVQYEVVV